jgi:polar amino acid transport system substrate-binding protein
MLKCLQACLVFCLATFALVAQEAKPLIVGMELSYPPFETFDAKGKPSGVSVDLAYALGKYLGRPIKIENIPFVGLIPSLKTGKIDLILSSMTVTPEREKSIDFSDPYLSTGLCLLINAQTAGNTLQELDVPENMIAVKLGTTGEAYALKHIKNAKVVSFDREATCILEVVQGKANAFIYDQFSVLKNWQKYPRETKANLKPFVKENWAMGLRKSDPQLKAQVNAFLKAFRQEGGFTQLANKYFKDQQKLFREQGIPFVFDVTEK